MDLLSKTMLWHQFGAAIDMLENAITACPDELWGAEVRETAFWYIAFHTLFYLDCYLSDSLEDFAPPPPFTLDELDERGLLPDRVYTKDELLLYLAYGRAKARARIQDLSEQDAAARCGFDWLDLSVGELLLYNMRHVQHHNRRSNLMLIQIGFSAPRWVRKSTDAAAG